MKLVTLLETNIAHESIGHPKRKFIFQPQIFRGYVSFREGKPFLLDGCVWMKTINLPQYVPPLKSDQRIIQQGSLYETNQILDLLKMLGASKNHFPKRWLDKDLPWYKVKTCLKQIQQTMHYSKAKLQNYKIAVQFHCLIPTKKEI